MQREEIYKLLDYLRLGYQIIVQVENGVQAVAAAEKEHFHFIFLDLRMPSMYPNTQQSCMLTCTTVVGGVEATKLIRKHEKETQVPEPSNIVGLTADILSAMQTEWFSVFARLWVWLLSLDFDRHYYIQIRLCYMINKYVMSVE